MMLAAIAIHCMRRIGRRRLHLEALDGLPSTQAPPSRLALTTRYVQAILPPRLGRQDVDRQHRSLASLAATLRVCLQHNDDAAEIQALVQELLDALQSHVDGEILLLRRLGVERAGEAIAADDERMAQARRHAADYLMGTRTLEQLVEFVTGDLVPGHLRASHSAPAPMEEALQRLRHAG